MYSTSFFFDVYFFILFGSVLTNKSDYLYHFVIVLMKQDGLPIVPAGSETPLPPSKASAKSPGFNKDNSNGMY